MQSIESMANDIETETKNKKTEDKGVTLDTLADDVAKLTVELGRVTELLVSLQPPATENNSESEVIEDNE